MPIGLLIGVAAVLGLGSTLSFGPTDRTPADVAAYRRAVVVDAEAAGEHVRVPGEYGLVVGSASPGPRAVALGAPPPATGRVTLV